MIKLILKPNTKAIIGLENWFLGNLGKFVKNAC